MKKVPIQKPLKIPKGFVNAARKGQVFGSAIRIKPGHRLGVINREGKVATSPKDIEKIIRKQRKENILKNPTPEGMTRREYIKLHTLPVPFRAKWHSEYKKLSRFWWDGFSREVQKEFRRKYPQPQWRKLFPLTAAQKGNRK